MRFDIVTDAQGDFMRSDGKLYVPGAEPLITPLQAYIAKLKSEDTAGALFTYDTHLEDIYPTSEEAKQFVIHCVKDSPGWQLVIDPSVVRVPSYVMNKGVFNMWQEPSLRIVSRDNPAESFDRDAFFADLKARGVDTVRVTGVAADYCVKWVADGLVARGFKVEVVDALTVGIQRSIKQVIQDDFANYPVTLV